MSAEAAYEGAANALAAYEAAIEDGQDPILVNQQDAPHLAAMLKQLLFEYERVTAPPTVSMVEAAAIAFTSEDRDDWMSLSAKGRRLILTDMGSALKAAEAAR